MCLTVFVCNRVVELERSQTSTGHEQESDVLDILSIFGIVVLEEVSACIVHLESSKSGHLEDLENTGFACHCACSSSISYSEK